MVVSFQSPFACIYFKSDNLLSLESSTKNELCKAVSTPKLSYFHETIKNKLHPSLSPEQQGIQSSQEISKSILSSRKHDLINNCCLTEYEKTEHRYPELKKTKKQKAPLIVEPDVLSPLNAKENRKIVCSTVRLLDRGRCGREKVNNTTTNTKDTPTETVVNCRRKVLEKELTTTEPSAPRKPSSSTKLLPLSAENSGCNGRALESVTKEGRKYTILGNSNKLNLGESSSYSVDLSTTNTAANLSLNTSGRTHRCGQDKLLVRFKTTSANNSSPASRKPQGQTSCKLNYSTPDAEENKENLTQQICVNTVLPQQPTTSLETLLRYNNNNNNNMLGGTAAVGGGSGSVNSSGSGDGMGGLSLAGTGGPSPSSASGSGAIVKPPGGITGGTGSVHSLGSGFPSSGPGGFGAAPSALSGKPSTPVPLFLPNNSSTQQHSPSNRPPTYGNYGYGTMASGQVSSIGTHRNDPTVNGTPSTSENSLPHTGGPVANDPAATTEAIKNILSGMTGAGGAGDGTNGAAGSHADLIFRNPPSQHNPMAAHQQHHYHHHLHQQHHRQHHLQHPNHHHHHQHRDPLSLSEKDFPSLGGDSTGPHAGTGFGGPGGHSGAIGSNLMGGGGGSIAGLMRTAGGETGVNPLGGGGGPVSEFQINNADFPSLNETASSGAPTALDAQNMMPNMSNAAGGLVSMGYHSADTAIGAGPSPRFPGDSRLISKPETGIQTTKNGSITNIPPQMIRDQFGIAGMLMLLRALETDPSIVSLAVGSDLTGLGLNLNSPERGLYRTFGGPWQTDAARPQDIDVTVPVEYLTNRAIGERLAPIRLNRYGDDLLFYLFYTYGGDVFQLAAAAELYNRDWRYSKIDRVWITRAPGITPVEKTSTFEYGTYYIFDPNQWRRITKELRVNYEHLEDKPVPVPFTVYPRSNPAGTINNISQQQQLQLAAATRQQQQQQQHFHHPQQQQPINPSMVQARQTINNLIHPSGATGNLPSGNANTLQPGSGSGTTNGSNTPAVGIVPLQQ